MATLHGNPNFKDNSKLLLVVDDRPEVRENISSVLATYGFQTVEASNGFEAKLMYDELPIDLVITNINMPEKDGISFIEELKKHHPNVKIIATSCEGKSSFIDCLELAIELGADNYCVKPFNHPNFVNVVESVVNKPEEQFHITH